MRRIVWAAVLALLSTSVGSPVAADVFPTEGKGLAFQENQVKECGTVTGDKPCFVQFSKVPLDKIIRVDRVDCVTLGSNARETFVIWLERPDGLVLLSSFVGAFTGAEGAANASGPYFFAGGQIPFVQGGRTDTILVCTIAGFAFDAAPV